MSSLRLILLIDILYSYLILAKDVFISLQHAKILKLIISVPHNGSFEAQIKTLVTTEHAKIEVFFILTIRVPHGCSFVDRLELFKLFEKMKP